MTSRHTTVPTLLTIAAAGSLLLAACSSGGSDEAEPVAASTKTQEASAAAEPSSEPSEVETTPAETEVTGDVAAPGTTVGFDTYLSYTFTNTDDEQAVLSAKLDSIDLATDSERADLESAFDEGELDGYDLYLIRMTEKKVSGASVEFNSDYSYFDPIKESGSTVQSVTVIGWDGCEQQSFDSAYDTEGAELQQCYIAAVPNGQPAPAGVAYTGGYEDDNPYDSYDGSPLQFIG
ncbi:MAG TPA: hypothetical protein VGC67_13600 [Cellulomonas sp.]